MLMLLTVVNIRGNSQDKMNWSSDTGKTLTSLPPVWNQPLKDMSLSGSHSVNVLTATEKLPNYFSARESSSSLSHFLCQAG